MARLIILVSLFLLISLNGSGQCVNPPALTLTSIVGSSCGTTSVIVVGNTFGGSATKVTLTEDGDGSVSPTSSTISPFIFTYTPGSKDIGKKVIITVITDNPLGKSCVAVKATYTLTVNATPSAPSVGTISQPTCSVATGSVVLNGLPSSGLWTLTRTPGGVAITGTGTSSTISGLTNGTYTYTTTTSTGCTSSSSSGIVINVPPATPASPTVTVDCTLGFGKAAVALTSPLGTGLQYRLDAGTYQNGTTFLNVANGSHTVSVRNAPGCVTTGAPFQVTCGCVNSPTLSLSTNSGTTCGIIPITVKDNTFGGTATYVTITENGAGTVSPAMSVSSPFSFTYTPDAGDAGNTVTIIVTTNNLLGLPCEAAKATYTLIVNANPSAPRVDAITQPTCYVATGSVVLSGLPATGIWTLIRNPGGVTTTGAGASSTISSLTPGTFTYTVTNATGCISVASGNVIISAQSSAPTTPVAGTITPATCILSTGSVVLNGLPATGNWTLTRYPGAVTTQGTGISITISGLSIGMYNYMVTNSTGCNSGLSANIIIPASSSVPSAPIVGLITQPVTGLPTGSVVLNGLPENGNWALTMTPGSVVISGTGISKTISGLAAGNYSFTVTNSAGCTSGSSGYVLINSQSGKPIVLITNPPPVCSPLTVNLTDPAVTAGSTPNLIYTYWADAAATIQYLTPGTATAGTYYIKGTTSAGLYTISPVLAAVFSKPIAKAGPDKTLEYLFETTLNAEPINNYESGLWLLLSGTGVFFDSANPKTPLKGLSVGKNQFIWTVKNGLCPISSDTVMIIVHNLVISTLITPNMDGKNDYFVLKGLDLFNKTELVVFDRRGVQVYRDAHYDNSWNGVDYKGNQLPDDTYFCIIKTEKGTAISGYVVIRR
jgi:gliding motility-associated-like protein